MDTTAPAIRVLLVDDEADFRRATRAPLERRGFAVTEAGDGETALEMIRQARPDIVLLDLKMPGRSGIETLRELRRIEPRLPVIVLTGHGGFSEALAGIRLQIVDFLQKPMDIDRLAARILHLVSSGAEPQPLMERTIAELMVSPSLYPRLHGDQTVAEAMDRITGLLMGQDNGEVAAHGLRSALVYDRDETFLGMLRFSNLLGLVMPDFLRGSPYASFFTGMFLAQCKVIGQRRFIELLDELVTIELAAPLLRAVHLMTAHRQISLPVMDGGRLVGVLRDRAVVLEIARSLHGGR
jgi:CheY-like chemotaxis protein